MYIVLIFVEVFICVHYHNNVYIGARLSGTILFKQLRVEGFIVRRWLKRWPEAFKQLNEWIEKVEYVML